MRTNRITVFVNDAELDVIDRAKGQSKRGSYLRECFTQHTQPEREVSLNKEAWLVLSKCAGTLETLAKMSVLGRADAETVKREIADFRLSLIVARKVK